MLLALEYTLAPLVMGVGLIYWASKMRKAEKARPDLPQFAAAKKLAEAGISWLFTIGLALTSFGMLGMIVIFN